jgi:hypothetical protein
MYRCAALLGALHYRRDSGQRWANCVIDMLEGWQMTCSKCALSNQPGSRTVQDDKVDIGHAGDMA